MFFLVGRENIVTARPSSSRSQQPLCPLYVADKIREYHSIFYIPSGYLTWPWKINGPCIDDFLINTSIYSVAMAMLNNQMGYGIFTYMTGWFMLGTCWYIFQHHGSHLGKIEYMGFSYYLYIECHYKNVYYYLYIFNYYLYMYSNRIYRMSSYLNSVSSFLSNDIPMTWSWYEQYHEC